MLILLAGGVGYIGSHTAVELTAAGQEVATVNSHSSTSKVTKRIGQHMKSIKEFLINSNGRLWNAFAVLLYGKKVFIKNRALFIRNIIKHSIPKKFYDKINFYKRTINNAKKEHKNCIFHLEEDGTLTPTEKITGVNILFSGKGNVVIIDKSCNLSNCKIHLGNNNFCLLEKSLYQIHNLNIFLQNNNNGNVIIDRNFFMPWRYYNF